jgi:hypothetical protein
MKKILLLVMLLVIAFVSQAQISAGLVLGGSVKETIPTGQALDKMFIIGATFKKQLTPTINLVSGAGYRFIDATVLSLPSQNDLVTHYKDVHPNEFYYITDLEYFRFSYFTVPIGLEVKLATFLRVSYQLENNFLIGANSTAEEYLQYGKKSVAAYMPTSNVSLLLHTGHAVGVAVGCILHPNILRKDINYTYGFMDEFAEEFRKSYILTVTLWGDLPFKKRKRI